MKIYFYLSDNERCKFEIITLEVKITSIHCP